MIKNGFQKKKHQVILNFDLVEYSFLSILLENGHTFEQSIKLIGKNSQNILDEIKNGYQLEEIILSTKKRRFKNLLTFFIKIYSVSEAIKYSISMIDFERKIRNKMIKESTYPIFILLFSSAIIYIFSNLIVPQLTSSFEIKDSITINVLYYVNSLCFAVIVVMLSLLMFSIFMKISYRFKIYFLKKFLHRFTFIKNIISFSLSGYLIKLHQSGLSTKQAFIFLDDLKSNTMFSYVCFVIRKELESGKELELLVNNSKYFSKQFKLNFSIGTNSNDFEKSLTSYIKLQEEKWINTIKKLSVLIQLTAYSFVGLLVICVYQIMLLPLQMLERI